MAEISLIFPDLRIPRRSIIGAKVDETPVRKVSLRETWGGRTIPLMHPGGSKVEIEISNDGDRVWTPSLDNIQPGQQITLHSSVWQSITIAPGAVEGFFRRDPVPGTVHARDADDENQMVDVAIAGRRATILGRAGYTTVVYRPIRHCIVGDVETSGSATGRSQGWKMILREEQAE